MPKKEMWDQFFDPTKIFRAFGFANFNKPGADLFCGYGTFTVPLAKLTTETIYAVDINQDFLKHLKINIARNELSNIKIIVSDISDAAFTLPEKIGYALLFNILHCEHPEVIITNVSKNLAEDGKIFVIHWRSDIETPRGPPLSIRPKMDDIESLMVPLGFKVDKRFEEIAPYHYGISFQKI